MFHVFQFRVRFPAALQKKSLGGDAMQRHDLKKCFWAYSFQNAGRHSPERTGARLLNGGNGLGVFLMSFRRSRGSIPRPPQRCCDSIKEVERFCRFCTYSQRCFLLVIPNFLEVRFLHYLQKAFAEESA